MIPRDEELSAITYEVMDSTAKFRITGKDELRKPESQGRPPDRADSLMLMAVQTPEQQEAFVMGE